MNLQPQEPGYECWNCGQGLWVTDEFRLWAWYRLETGKPSRPLCMSCAMKRHGAKEVHPYES